MLRPFAHAAPICVLIAVALSFSVVSAQSQPASSPADARLRALYTEEWHWRQQELGRGGAGDRFPRVDAASQQAKLAYWTRTLATLDTIPFDQLSPEEAYKLGELQIRRHRREAEEKLGARFDQRRFHDAILAIGSVPLPVLERRMVRFIADESATAKD